MVSECLVLTSLEQDSSPFSTEKCFKINMLRVFVFVDVRLLPALSLWGHIYTCLFLKPLFWLDTRLNSPSLEYLIFWCFGVLYPVAHELYGLPALLVISGLILRSESVKIGYHFLYSGGCLCFSQFSHMHSLRSFLWNLKESTLNLLSFLSVFSESVLGAVVFLELLGVPDLSPQLSKWPVLHLDFLCMVCLTLEKFF